MTILELSKKTGLSSDTIRYYEKIGVLPKPKKTQNGYRHYEEITVTRVKMLTHAKKVGFSIRELKTLSQLFLSKKLNGREMSKRLKSKLVEIDRRIDSLNQLKLDIHSMLKGECEFRDELI